MYGPELHTVHVILQVVLFTRGGGGPSGAKQSLPHSAGARLSLGTLQAGKESTGGCLIMHTEWLQRLSANWKTIVNGLNGVAGIPDYPNSCWGFKFPTSGLDITHGKELQGIVVLYRQPTVCRQGWGYICPIFKLNKQKYATQYMELLIVNRCLLYRYKWVLKLESHHC